MTHRRRARVTGARVTGALVLGALVLVAAGSAAPTYAGLPPDAPARALPPLPPRPRLPPLPRAVVPPLPPLPPARPFGVGPRALPVPPLPPRESSCLLQVGPTVRPPHVTPLPPHVGGPPRACDPPVGRAEGRTVPVLTAPRR